VRICEGLGVKFPGPTRRLWARTLDKTSEGWVQADRGGRPMQAVCLVGEKRAAYLSGEPANDKRFIRVFAHELEHKSGYSPQDAIAAARSCYQTFSFTTLVARYPFRTMAGHSPTMLSTCSCLYSRTGR